MIRLTDLKRAINTVLEANFPDHARYADDVQEGYERPCFFVQMFPVTFDYATINYASIGLVVVINYFSKNKTQLENLKMHDALKEAFGRSLQVNNRYLHLQNIRSDEVDGVLQFKFDLEYLEGVEKDLTGTGYDVMEELILSKEE